MFHFVHKKNRVRTSANPIFNTMASLWLLQLLMFIRFCFVSAKVLLHFTMHNA